MEDLDGGWEHCSERGEVCMAGVGKVTNGEWLAYERRRTETKKYGSDQVSYTHDLHVEQLQFSKIFESGLNAFHLILSESAVIRYSTISGVISSLDMTNMLSRLLGCIISVSVQ